MNNGWEIVKIEDILLIPSRNGLTKPSAIRGKGVKMIAMGELFAHPIISDIEMDRVPVTDKELQSTNVEVNDLLFARQSLTLEGAGKCSIVKEVNEPTVFESHLIRLRINSNIADPWHVYYYFNSYYGKHSIQNIVNQVAAAGIKGSDLVKLEIPLPSLDEQKKISSMLFSYDEKISTNRKICANLEAQAQALFKHWFIDFAPFKDGKFVESELGMIPEGWRVGRLGELPLYISDYVANGSFASLRENVSLYNEENYAYFIRNTDLKEKRFKVYVDKKSYDFLSKSVLHGGEIIISNVGDVGSVHLCPVLDKPMTLGNNIIMIKSGNIALQNYLYILFKYSYGQGLIHSITGGTAQPKFNKTDFKSLKIAVPSEKSLQEFNDFIKNLLQTIQLKDSENNHLSEIRDSILPKLMSGEIKV